MDFFVGDLLDISESEIEKMSTLQIIGLCLLAPFVIFVIINFVLQIIEDIKKDPIAVVACTIVIMAIIGLLLLLCFG